MICGGIIQEQVDLISIYKKIQEEKRMIDFIKDESLLPVKKVGRVGIRAWYNKDNTVSYQFRVSSSKTKSKVDTWRNTEMLSGRKLRTKLETKARSIEEQIESEEEAVIKGAVSIIPSDISFNSYVNHFIEVNRDLKQTTLQSYKRLAVRCNESFGTKKICEITVPMLNQFYIDLSKTKKQNGKKARCKVDLRKIMKPFYITQVELYTISGLSDKTVEACVNGKNIEYENAQKIFKAFNKVLNDEEKLANTNGIKSRKRKPEPPITSIPKYKFSDLFEIVKCNETLSPKTVWEYHQFIYSVLSLAVNEGVIKYNPADAVKKPKYDTPEQDVFTPEEIQSILTIIETEFEKGNVSAKWRAIIYLLIYTGGRRGEIAGLRWQSIDFKNKVIDINNTWLYTYGVGSYSSTPKTKKSVRKLTIAENLLEVLEDYRIEYEHTKSNSGLKKKLCKHE